MTSKKYPRKKVRHTLKLLEQYADVKFKGLKPFEIRDIKDRVFCIGDEVVYKVVDEGGRPVNHDLNKLVFEITFISNFMQRHDYVVYADKLCSVIE